VVFNNVTYAETSGYCSLILYKEAALLGLAHCKPYHMTIFYFFIQSKELGRIHLVAANGEEEENLIPCSDFWDDRNVAYVAYSIHVGFHRLSTLFQRRKCLILHLHKVYLVDSSSYLDDIVPWYVLYMPIISSLVRCPY